MTVARTYLDYNATAPLRPEARAAVIAGLDVLGNPSSVHTEGRKARGAIETARTSVADLVGARPADVVFTSGASEANATVLAGGWSTIYLSALEHDSVRVAAQRSGARVIDVPVLADGRLDLAALATLIGIPGTDHSRDLVCLQLANNETGVIQPVAEAASLAKAAGIRVHCDAVQAPGRMAIDCTALGANYVTISSHKLGGPKGAGALIVVNGAPLPALIAGGGQERGRRAGTENGPALAGFGAAAVAAKSELTRVAKVEALRDMLEQGVARLTPEAKIVGARVPRLANTSCVAMPGASADSLVIRLDLAGVAVSAGSACSSGKVGASAALAAMGLVPDLARGAIRISIGYASTADDVEAFLAAWKSIAAAHRRAA